MNLRRILIFAAFLMLVLVGTGFGQTPVTKEKECPDKKKHNAPKIRRKKISMAKGSAGTSAAEGVSIGRRRSRNTSTGFIWNGRNDNPIEKSIAVASKVVVEMKVCRGVVKINGWKRNEIRALLVNGRSLGFSVKQRTSDGEKPAWVKVLGRESNRVNRRNSRLGRVGRESNRVSRRNSRPRRDCISGKKIELDVPFNTSLKIRSENGTTYIDSVRSVKVDQLRGSIYLDNIRSYIAAETHKGNIIVRNSGGKISTQTFSGNIIAYKTKTREIGDTFVARTFGGAITLQSVGQRDVKATTISGAIRYIGTLAKRGGYSFGTTRGLIRLVIPEKTSCTIDAIFGGKFRSQIPIKELEKTKDDFVFHLKGRFGEGSCELKFKTPYGRIFIETPKKKEIHPIRQL